MPGSRPARAGGRERGFLSRVYKDGAGGQAGYVLFVPHAYKGDHPYPLILFLHGAGESGSDGLKPAAVGLGPAIRKRERTFPFLTVFPQSRRRSWRGDAADAQRALAILAEVHQEFAVDPRRIYLTGLSMGGFGTWSLAGLYPDRWAALAPVCGGGDPRKAETLKRIPCWCFHGAADPIVPVNESRVMVEALRAAGGDPRYTEYPGVGHNSWDRAYNTEELYSWFLSSI